jgi:integrase
VRSYGTLAGEFIAFAGTRGGLERCDAATVGAFTATLAGYQAKTVEQKLCALRSFLRFAAGDGLAGTATAEAVPAVPSRRQTRVPSVWDQADVARILDAVDRGNPCGKRDYAIILLVARLGLRSIDVKRLEFADFDWPGCRLSVAQAKTGIRIWLPLLKDVGWAVIDYARNGRPASGCPQVFLRHTAPVGPFSDQEHLHQMLVKYARAAHVPVSDKRRRGMHSLRHTLATRLKMSRIASDATFPGRGERPWPALRRWNPRREQARAGSKVADDLRWHYPVASAHAMLHPDLVHPAAA